MNPWKSTRLSRDTGHWSANFSLNEVPWNKAIYVDVWCIKYICILKHFDCFLQDIDKGLLLGKDLIYGTNFTNSTEEQAGLLRPQSEAQAKSSALGQGSDSLQFQKCPKRIIP